MGRFFVGPSTRALLGSLLVVACGGRAHSDGAEEPAVNVAGSGGSTSTGGTAVSTAGAGTGVGGGGATSPQRPEPEPQPPMQIAGRWAMFTFEDPVGVQLTQTNGELVGQGCAGGTPPLVDGYFSCGDIRGSVAGNTAKFGFSFENYHYHAETIISANGQRMTGRFHALYDWLDSPSAWLRVPDGAEYLESMGSPLEPTALAGRYELRLREGEGGEYVRNVPYALWYSRRSMGGHLGSFWGTEASDPAAGSPVRVGPVPATSPELPVSLQLDFDEGGFTQVRATTASRNAYTFDVTRL
jgi:hypothetical protein